MTESWHYVDKFGTSRGPCTIEDMINGYCSGDLFDRTYVWDGITVKTWTPIGNIPHLLDRLERARIHYLAKANPQIYSVLNVSSNSEHEEKTKVKSNAQSIKTDDRKQRIPIIADSTTTPTSNEHHIEFPTSTVHTVNTNTQTVAGGGGGGGAARPNLNKNNTFNVHHNPSIHKLAHDNSNVVTTTVSIAHPSSQVSSARSSDSELRENMGATTATTATSSDESLHMGKDNDKKKKTKKSPKRVKKYPKIDDMATTATRTKPLGQSDPNKLNSESAKRVPFIQVGTLLNVPPPPATTPPATPIEQKYNFPDFTTKEKEMRVQKVEFQKALEKELENIKRELDSKFSEFGSRLERYYKRQCLHVHQHRQVIEWYHTQIQLQGLNQTRSNLMNDKEEADTDVDAEEINNTAQSNNIRASYPIATEWNMEDEDTDENQLTSNYPRSRDRGKTEHLHKNKKQNLEVQHQNETQQVLLGKIKSEIDIIQNISLEKDFQSLIERIHQIKQSVIDL